MADALRDALEKAIGFQYDIIGLLGRGGMGAVYHAHEKALDRPVAIKVLPPDAVGADARERFLREARTAARLTHPNIVPLFTFGETQGLVYYVMGYVDGESLEQRIRRGPLDAETAKGLLTQLANALHYAHEQGIVHRDVKPDNVLIERGTGVAKLTDFGIAKRSTGGETLTGTGLLMGTPKYMSPEQAAGERDLDARSDIYALGLVGYAMLTGRPPFDGGSVQEILTQQVTREAPSLRKLFPEMESGVALTIERALRKKPEERWATAGSMAAAFGEEGTDDLEGLTDRKIKAGSYAIFTLGMGIVAANLFLYTAVKSGNWLLMLGPLLFMFGTVIDYAVMRWREKRSRAEIRRVFTQPPQWWPYWWPARWRRQDDVWHRLPKHLKVTRGLLSGMILGSMVAFQLIFVGLTLGKGNPASQPIIITALSLFPVALGCLAGAAVMAVRWQRKSGLGRMQADRLITASTSHPKLWKQPWAAKWLTSAATESTALEPATPSAIAAEVAVVRSKLPAVLREQVSDADDAAAALARAIDALDTEIASLARSFDQAEVERLEQRIAALGSARGNEPDGQREMRQLYTSQLDLLRRLARQSQELSERRARYVELLRTLWRQLHALRADSTIEDVKLQDLTARIRHIADSVARDVAPQAPTREAVRT